MNAHQISPRSLHYYLIIVTFIIIRVSSFCLALSLINVIFSYRNRGFLQKNKQAKVKRVGIKAALSSYETVISNFSNPYIHKKKVKLLLKHYFFFFQLLVLDSEVILIRKKNAIRFRLKTMIYQEYSQSYYKIRFHSKKILKVRTLTSKNTFSSLILLQFSFKLTTKMAKNNRNTWVKKKL